MSETTSYHHGDLRAALVAAAIEMLEAGQTFSLRAVARAVGVSQAAPYRHFPDRDALEAAVATVGFRDLQARLEALLAGFPSADLTDLAVVYVDFVLDRPALFRLMLCTPCASAEDERRPAIDALYALIGRAAASGGSALATGGWALAHGLAVLHLDGRLPATSRDDLRAQVRGAFDAVVGAGRGTVGA